MGKLESGILQFLCLYTTTHHFLFQRSQPETARHERRPPQRCGRDRPQLSPPQLLPSRVQQPHLTGHPQVGLWRRVGREALSSAQEASEAEVESMRQNVQYRVLGINRNISLLRYIFNRSYFSSKSPLSCQNKDGRMLNQLRKKMLPWIVIDSLLHQSQRKTRNWRVNVMSDVLAVPEITKCAMHKLRRFQTLTLIVCCV